TEVDGRISVAFDGQAMDPDTAPSARLSIRLDSLRSGNALYDAELLRRVNARQHPETIIALRDTEHPGLGSLSRHRRPHLSRPYLHDRRDAADPMAGQRAPTREGRADRRHSGFRYRRAFDVDAADLSRCARPTAIRR
ncbi:MAG: hypothetical protein ABI808_16175, partial [Pseudonocardiales bacterium]